MKRIGLLGGMSWESSIEYERIINEGVRARLGGVHSADLVIRSYDFAEIEKLQESGDWDQAGRVLASDARLLEASGAEVIVLCTNTMHKVADMIERAISVPFIHLADATARAIIDTGASPVALLGTRYTMEEDFYRDRLARQGVTAIIPDEPDRTMIHEVIFSELVRGVTTETSKASYLAAIARLLDQGAKGIIAGCTEIELLVGPEDVEVPYFPTTRLHALAAVEWALAN